ncbi:uncharacterized protein Dwil_GK25851 [Drosophila willistoni]|uniref:U2A'/phosphoprotein 32 family A C-terminal domain-containing protein n=1 Tax=Drosophila willistoni TaxID=7260 RepID=B4NCG7_DROWI|nr:uncharacterized protein F09G8.5 [Drosophila willistoni]EDW82526.1 uncharacterized protein Dwil_GK25851 [Drosophila willistoni]
MVKLSQQLIEARGKGLDYRQILNLNIWGTDLDDISIFTEMPLLEILSLSLNQVTTLQGLRNCHNLKELYLRKNLIADISELNYLKGAKNLKTFWLLENPCADTLGDNYRRSVIKHLPQLRFLDGVAITDAELESALNDEPPMPPMPPRAEPRGPPPEEVNPIPRRASNKNRREENKKEREQEKLDKEIDRKRTANSSCHVEKSRRASPPAPLEISRPVVQERPPSGNGDGNHMEQQSEPTMPMQPMQPMPQAAQGPQTIHVQHGPLAHQMPQVSQVSQMAQMPSMQQLTMQPSTSQSAAASRSFWSGSPGPDFSQNDRYMEQMNYQRSHDPMSSNFMGGCRQEEMEKMHYQAANSMMFPMNNAASPNHREHYGRSGPVRSNVNILSSIRYLIRELDPASLVVLGQAIHEQMAKMLPSD